MPQNTTTTGPLRQLLALATLVLVLAGCRQIDQTEESTPLAEETVEETAEQTATPVETVADEPPTTTSDAMAALDAGDHTFSFIHDGRIRSYIVHVPPAEGPFPVVLALHGGGGTGAQFQRENGLDPVADREGFLAVYPEGTGILPNRLHTWNSGDTCCGFALDRDIDDVGYLRQLLVDLAEQIAIDSGRVYATGHSNGGMMAYRFAAEAPELVTAIAPVGGAIDFEISELEEPVALLHIHSRDDPRALYDGGEGPPFPGTNRTVNHEPVIPGIAAWASANGCGRGTEVGDAVRGEGENEGQTFYTLTWLDCDAGTKVEHLVLSGSGHGWPGVTAPRAVQRHLGEPTTIINASEEVWAFVSQFER